MNADLRIGEAERDRAASVLGDHYAAGRLDHAEYSERLDAIWTARTRADLDLVFHDLPRLAPTMPAMPTMPSGSPARGGLPWPVVALLVLVVGAVVLTHLPAVLLVVAAIVLLKVSRHRNRTARRQQWQQWQQWQWRQFHGSQPGGRW